ncbi:hypothetical protein AMAG_15667 [Allomyces macrogynus ATCC 38327]|uniref:Ras-GAP domain-containing protein n=1 Tax=Allomyces macrogynus (strain ATCC 38327) TaxID=578462 RepID=A0A0L0T9F0_ALLM3|nr:hypothetical protein AMAG_15667 [Allomyces macrogynus ATCC 38327]|eukprot:KNE71433.1 hypothetical protein AMAG_15667 [Allomyces macrogynus ATCC 38327]
MAMTTASAPVGPTMSPPPAVGGAADGTAPYSMAALATALPASATYGARRISYAHFLAARAEQELAVDDELAKAQKRLTQLKELISMQSKKNFVLERDVRLLDSRIALLIQNRMQLDDKDAKDLAHVLQGDDDDNALGPARLDDRKLQLYGNLFFLLQTEPRYLATLCRVCTLDQMDALLQTVMFTVYGKQYDRREEYLLLTMFQTVLAHQFDHATDFGSLMRANTPVSRMLTTYTRRGPGQAYLKSLLSERIASLIKHKDLNLEINPVKVYQQILESTGDSRSLATASSLPADQVAQIPQVQQLVQARVRMLLEIATSFLKTIVDSLDRVPYGIRWICKQIKGLAKRKYPEATDTQLCSLVGGFFLLRYINPAIVTPQGFMLVPSAPSTNPRRTLTLIAKMLQNVANKPSQTKEAYMAPLNAWSERNKDRVQRFLLKLADVGDFYEELELNQYLALSRRDQLRINISANEMFATHSLLTKHRDTVCQPESHLAALLKDLGPAPAALPRVENATYTLTLYSRWETHLPDSSELIKNSTDVSASEALYLETKAAFVQLLRRVPSLAAPPPPSVRGRPSSIPPVPPLPPRANGDISAAANAHDNDAASNSSTSTPTPAAPALDLMAVTHAGMTLRSDDGVVQQAVRARAMVLELERLGVVSRRDGYRILADEIAAELAHLGSLRDKLSKEIESLEDVYRAIGEHNEYLNAQLETYKAYLANVRMKTAKSPGPSFGKKKASSEGAKSPATNASSPAPSIMSGGNRSRANSSPSPSAITGTTYPGFYGTSYGGGGMSYGAGGAGMSYGLGTSVMSDLALSATPGASASVISSAVLAASQHVPTSRAFSYAFLERDGVITESSIPEARRPHISMSIMCPSPGCFLISLEYKGRDRPLLEMDLRLDDLLEKQQGGELTLDLTFLRINVARLVHLLNKYFLRK